MTDLFGKRPLRTVVTGVLTSLGGRVSHNDLVEGVRHTLTMAEYQDWSDRAFRTEVIRVVKGRRENPTEEVYSTGDELVVLQLFTVPEFENKARELAGLGKANLDGVYRLQAICKEVHGRTFDADAVCSEAGIGPAA